VATVPLGFELGRRDVDVQVALRMLEAELVDKSRGWLGWKYAVAHRPAEGRAGSHKNPCR